MTRPEGSEVGLAQTLSLALNHADISRSGSIAGRRALLLDTLERPSYNGARFTLRPSGQLGSPR